MFSFVPIPTPVMFCAKGGCLRRHHSSVGSESFSPGGSSPTPTRGFASACPTISENPMFPFFEEPEFAEPWELWIRATFLHQFVQNNGRWLWPTLETLHFLGLSLLFATIGLFDLRVLGLGKAIPPGALHRLIPIGIAGYAVNVLTGIVFFSGFPEQYFYNAAFWWKGTFM